MTSRRLDASAWVDAREWARALPWQRERWLAFVAAELRAAKVRQISSGVGADGRPLRRVKPTSRPDGTRDRPLIPHDDESRAIRLLKVTANARTGEVVIHWHGWTRVMGYHAEGAGNLPVRDVLGTPGRFLRPVRTRALAEWRRIVPSRILAGGTPPAAAASRPRPGPRAPFLPPAVARPRERPRPGFF